MAKLIIEGNVEKNSIVTFHVSYQKNNGEVTVRDMPVDDLCSLLSGHKKEIRKGVSVEVPKEFLRSDIERYCKTLDADGKDTGFSFAIILPPEKTGFVLYNKLPVIVPQPRRVVFYSSCGELNIFALKGDGAINDGTPLWWYPLGHVEQSGSTCKGNVPMRSDTYEEAIARIRDFFTAGTEGHYFQPGVTITKNIGFGKMIEKLEEKDYFPEAWLQPAAKWKETQLTFQKAWEQFI